MSRTYLIKTKKDIDFLDVFNKLKYDRSVNIIKKSDVLVYFYGPWLSTRGVDLSLEEDGYEIRTTTMSNRTDLSIASRLMKIISEMTGGKVFDEENNELTGPKYLSDDFIENSFIYDLKLVFNIIREDGSLFEFQGPTRSVYIGKRIFNENINYERRIKTTAKNIEGIFINVLYRFDDWEEEGSILAVEAKKKDKIIKLKSISPEYNYIVQNYDYLIISDEDDEANKKELVLIKFV